ncbi:MAG TPA: hypothetical protein VNE40_04395 [Candidatus Dormibacteraeota bacterium]|nr:hypothetical protein [Candidatus Dormibacteraeota bacterium]
MDQSLVTDSDLTEQVKLASALENRGYLEVHPEPKETTINQSGSGSLPPVAASLDQQSLNQPKDEANTYHNTVNNLQVSPVIGFSARSKPSFLSSAPTKIIVGICVLGIIIPGAGVYGASKLLGHHQPIFTARSQNLSSATLDQLVPTTPSSSQLSTTESFRKHLQEY